MNKRAIGTVPLIYPVPIVLVGAMVEGRGNFSTIGDAAIMGIRPALVCISMNRTHFTTGGIQSSNAFSINVPTTSQVSVVDYCGIVSGKTVNKAELFTLFYGDGGAPMIEECPVNLDCTVEKEIQIEHRCIFIGRVVQTYVDEQFVDERDERTVAEMQVLDPIMYALDNRYYRVGGVIGTGYDEGRQYRESSRQDG